MCTFNYHEHRTPLKTFNCNKFIHYESSYFHCCASFTFTSSTFIVLHITLRNGDSIVSSNCQCHCIDDNTNNRSTMNKLTKITSQRLTSFSLTLFYDSLRQLLLRQPLQEQVQPLQLNHLVLMQQQLTMRYSGHYTHLSHDDFLAIRKR